MGVSTVVALVGFRPIAYPEVRAAHRRLAALAAPPRGTRSAAGSRTSTESMSSTTLIIVRPIGRGAPRSSGASSTSGFIDRYLVNLSGILVRQHGGRGLRLLQTGYVQTYAFFMVLGLIVVLLRLLALVRRRARMT